MRNGKEIRAGNELLFCRMEMKKDAVYLLFLSHKEFGNALVSAAVSGGSPRETEVEVD